MAIKDVFNNSANNYIKTGLSPCTSPDTNVFGFLPGEEVGIINGSDIVQSMFLGDIKVEVNSWVQNKKTLNPQEVTFIPGLTKGLNKRVQAYVLPFSPSDASLLYMGLDISINYYSSFKNTSTQIVASSNPASNINVINDLNMRFDQLGIHVFASLDSSVITFSGDDVGYNFNVNSMGVLNFDASMLIPTISSSYEDVARSIPYAKYNNGAVVGMVIKAEYPIEQSTYDKWVYINHVNNEFSFFDDTSTYVTKTVDVGSNTSTATTIGAPDYLYYLTANNLWDKMGYLNIKVNTFDPADSNVKNLIPGFYLYNPHSFNVEVDYMLIY